jgi:hypothetical protein
MKVFAGLARPTIRNERELVRFVALVTAFALTFALAVDVVDQLTSFVDWTRCLRSWSVTTVVCLEHCPATMAHILPRRNSWRRFAG